MLSFVNTTNIFSSSYLHIYGYNQTIYTNPFFGIYQHNYLDSYLIAHLDAKHKDRAQYTISTTIDLIQQQFPMHSIYNANISMTELVHCMLFKFWQQNNNLPHIYSYYFPMYGYMNFNLQMVFNRNWCLSFHTNNNLIQGNYIDHHQN